MVCIYDMYSTTTTISSKLESGKAQEKSLLLSSAEMAERKEKYGPAIDKWESITAQPLSEYELTTVCELVDRYGAQWVLDAIGITGDAGKPNLRYTKAILNNWHTDGRDGMVKKSTAKRGDDMTIEELKATFM